MTKTLFVTVGTTLFQPLVDAVCSKEALEWIGSENFSHLVVQYGKGKCPSVQSSVSHLVVECYDFKPSLQADLNRADWIICHAGAGTLMEALGLASSKVVTTVINTRLMDNHQTELAFALRDRGHLQVVEDAELLRDQQTWDNLVRGKDSMRAWKSGNTKDFPRIVNSFLGVSTASIDKDG